MTDPNSPIPGAQDPTPQKPPCAPETAGPGAMRRNATITAAQAPAPSPVDAGQTFKRKMMHFGLVIGGTLLAVYLLAAHVVIPYAWGRYLARHPGFDDPDMPKVTKTSSGLPGDPLNVALIGSKEEVIAILLRAGWVPADDRTVSSCLKIVQTTLLRRRYDSAPMSDLYVYERKQDLAFQFPLENPNKRHHVRFWASHGTDDEGRPLWVGAATFDDKVGPSLTTGQITHHIHPEIDHERDKLFRDLLETGWLIESTLLDSFHDILEGRNGGGHPYRTDGRLAVGLVRVARPEE
jgi:LssY C-terminus